MCFLIRFLCEISRHWWTKQENCVGEKRKWKCSSLVGVFLFSLLFCGWIFFFSEWNSLWRHFTKAKAGKRNVTLGKIWYLMWCVCGVEGTAGMRTDGGEFTLFLAIYYSSATLVLYGNTCEKRRKQKALSLGRPTQQNVSAADKMYSICHYPLVTLSVFCDVVSGFLWKKMILAIRKKNWYRGATEIDLWREKK